MLSVVIPWRTDNGQRERIHKWILARYSLLFPETQVVTTDSGHENFNRSASRNKGVSKSQGEYILFADADTIPIPEYIEAGIQLLNKGAPWVLPYGLKKYYNLNNEASESLLKLPPSTRLSEPSESQYDHKITSWAGLVLVRKEHAEQYPYDERFTHWGWEDVAFRLTLDNELGPHARVASGYAVHLHHDRSDATFDTQEELRCRKLFDQEYRRRYNWKDERY